MSDKTIIENIWDNLEHLSQSRNWKRDYYSNGSRIIIPLDKYTSLDIIKMIFFDSQKFFPTIVKGNKHIAITLEELAEFHNNLID